MPREISNIDAWSDSWPVPAYQVPQAGHAAGRPRVPPSFHSWDFLNQARQGAYGFPDHRAADSRELSALLGDLTLENREGECFRNAALAILLNNSVFVNWLMRQTCSNSDCLVGAFRKLSEEYCKLELDRDNKVLFYSLHQLWEVCQNQFWGSKARRSQKIGPDIGGDAEPFLFWLVHYMRRESCLQSKPAELQWFDQIFSIEFAVCFRCKAGHVCTTNHIRWDFINLTQRTGIQNTTGLKKSIDDWMTVNSLAPEEYCHSCPCRRDEQLSTHLQILNAPEILFIRAPERDGLDRSPSNPDFAFGIALPEEISLDHHSQTGSSLGYELRSVTVLEIPNHEFSVVRATDGNLYEVNDSAPAKQVRSWAELEGRQWAPRLEDMLFPQLLVYVRKPELAADRDADLGAKTMDLKEKGKQKSPTKRKADAVDESVSDDGSELSEFQRVGELKFGYTEDVGNAQLTTRVVLHQQAASFKVNGIVSARFTDGAFYTARVEAIAHPKIGDPIYTVRFRDDGNLFALSKHDIRPLSNKFRIGDAVYAMKGKWSRSEVWWYGCIIGISREGSKTKYHVRWLGGNDQTSWLPEGSVREQPGSTYPRNCQSTGDPEILEHITGTCEYVLDGQTYVGDFVGKLKAKEDVKTHGSAGGRSTRRKRVWGKDIS